VSRRVFASTTAHKREPLLATLEVFARLGLLDLDLNLHHVVEGGADAEAIAAAADRHRQHVWVVSGGWCDFFHRPPEIARTFESVARQVGVAGTLGARMLRLFFGRLARASYDAPARETIVANLTRLSDEHPEMLFVFENHDGASLVPEICREVLAAVARPNIRMNFDPINFAIAGADPEMARATVQPLVAHVHLKGSEGGHICEFGTGDVDLTPVLQRLARDGYAGDFTVEYEGPFDGTLRLYESVQRARTAAAALD
jgi:sugar phosphate isomerase/epimerase